MVQPCNDGMATEVAFTSLSCIDFGISLSDFPVRLKINRIESCSTPSVAKWSRMHVQSRRRRDSPNADVEVNISSTTMGRSWSTTETPKALAKFVTYFGKPRRVCCNQKIKFRVVFVTTHCIYKYRGMPIVMDSFSRKQDSLQISFLFVFHKAISKIV